MAVAIRDTKILLYPPFRVENGRFTLNYAESAEQLRFYLLYFDSLALAPVNLYRPMSNFIATTQEEQLLAQQGIVEYLPPRIIRVGAMDRHFLAPDMSRMYRKLNRSGPMVALGHSSYLAVGTGGAEWNSAILELRNVLPSPHASMPLHDLIAFRTDNSDALRQMHFAIDKIFASFGAAGVKDFDLVVDELMQRLDDVQDRFAKKGFPYFGASLSVSQVVAQYVLAPFCEAVGLAIGAPPTLGTAIGGSVALTLNRSRLARAGNVYPRDFEYVFKGSEYGLYEDAEDAERDEWVGILPSILQHQDFGSDMPKKRLENELWQFNAGFNELDVKRQFPPGELADFYPEYAQHRNADDDHGLDDEPHSAPSEE